MSLHDRMTEASRSLHGPCQDFDWTDVPVPVPTGSKILYKADRQPPPKHLIYNSNKLLSTTSHLSTQSKVNTPNLPPYWEVQQANKAHPDNLYSNLHLHLQLPTNKQHHGSFLVKGCRWSPLRYQRPCRQEWRPTGSLAILSRKV